MILKHRDKELLRFDFFDPFGVRNVEIEERNVRFLPLAFRELARKGVSRALDFAIEDWLLHRVAPANRHGFRAMLGSVGIMPGDPRYRKELICLCRGLSLNDVHWVVEDTSREKWAEVNLYQNPFSTAVASAAFSGVRAEHARDVETSPEYTTDGTLAKCWRRLGGAVLLYKGGEREPYSEFFAAQLAQAMKLPHVNYRLASFKGQTCSVCPLFTSERTGFVPAIVAKPREEALADPSFSDIFFFDAIIFNTDRHLRNFGYLVDNDTNEICGTAPIFDNGRGLFSRVSCLKTFPDNLMPAALPSWLAIPGGVTESMRSRLEGLEKFAFQMDTTYAFDSERLSRVQYFVRNRIEKILRFGEKADSYISISSEARTVKRLREKSPDLSLDDQILGAVRLLPRVTRAKLARIFKVGTTTISKHLKSLQVQGRLRRVGADKNGRWEAV